MGAEGYLGRAFVDHFKALGWPWQATTHRHPHHPWYLNLAEPYIEQLPRLEQFSHVLICGAWSRLLACEHNPEQSRRVNLYGPVQLVRQLCPRGLRVIVFSSDYVFDGTQAPYTEFSPPSPCNHYGAQKAALETALLSEFSAQVLVLRLSKVYDPHPQSPTLLGEMVQKLRRGQRLLVAIDQCFNPVACEDVLHATTALIQAGQSGLWNVAGPDAVNRWELALRLVEKLQLDRTLLCPIQLRDLQEPLIRPTNTVLDISRLRAALPDWEPLSLEKALLRLQESS